MPFFSKKWVGNHLYMEKWTLIYFIPHICVSPCPCAMCQSVPLLCVLVTFVSGPLFLCHCVPWHHVLCPTPFLADPGVARDCSKNTSVTHWFIDWVILLLKYLYGAQTVKNCAFSHKTNTVGTSWRDSTLPPFLPFSFFPNWIGL